MKILIRNHGNKKWNLVEASGYAVETELQSMLAESPSLISIDEIRPGSPPLVAAVREVGLPGSGYTDLLAFNAQGDIAIVECKLGANQEIKRKVIAQVLEYGAYLWTLTFDQLSELVYKKTNQNLTDFVGTATDDPSWDSESFRSAVEDNLSKGSFILVIAVDEMNDELERTMRFINQCGNPAFNFTVLEVKRFQREHTEILVPNLHGVASAVSKEKGLAGHKQWTESEFYAKTEMDLPADLHGVITDLYQWTVSKADHVWFGNGMVKGSFTFRYIKDEKTVSIFSLFTDGTLVINYGHFSKSIDENLMDEFHQRLCTLPGFGKIPGDFLKFPSVKVDQVFLGKPESVQKFKEIVEDFGMKVKG